MICRTKKTGAGGAGENSFLSMTTMGKYLSGVSGAVAYLKKNWRRALPNLGLLVEFPFVRFQVVVLYERLEMMTVEWFSLSWRIGKYYGEFRLYWRPRF